MEFRLDDQQIELQQTVGRFCSANFPLDALDAREGRPVDRSTWRSLADLGVLGILLTEAEGGAGLGAVEATLVYEQLGRHLVPGPVLWSLLAAPLVEGVARGDTIVAGVDASAVVHREALVPHASEMDVLVVAHADKVVAHRLDALAVPEPTNALDPLGSVSRVAGIDAGIVIGDAVAAERVASVGTLLAAAMLVGIGDRSLQVACEYAMEREQFNAPIGSFQAVKHILADMYVRTSSAQSAAYAAAAALDDPGFESPRRAIAVAKLLAADCAIENATAAIQVLGGMGFTWAMPPNYLLKRAWTLEHEFGSMDEHAFSLGALIGSVS